MQMTRRAFAPCVVSKQCLLRQEKKISLYK
jgi:hypothetical protein